MILQFLCFWLRMILVWSSFNCVGFLQLVHRCPILFFCQIIFCLSTLMSRNLFRNCFQKRFCVVALIYFHLSWNQRRPPRFALFLLGLFRVKRVIVSCWLLDLWRVLLVKMRLHCIVLLLILQGILDSFYDQMQRKQIFVVLIMSELDLRRFSLTRYAV